MSDDIATVSSIIDRFSRPSGRMQLATTPEGSKAPYRFAEMDKTEKSSTLRVHYSNGDTEIVRYVYMTNVLHQASTGSVLILFNAGGILMTGRNLYSLMEPLENERVRQVRPFDPDRHLEPEDGHPLIESIRWVPLRELTGNG